MLAFAGNSIICRIALLDGTIDPYAFTAIRLLSGCAVLLAILGARKEVGLCRGHGSWLSGMMLFVYAIMFSVAYVEIATGTGALILFGTVQGTMILAALYAGNSPRKVEVAGWSVALAGLIYLLLPGARAPSLVGALSMSVAGIAWGIYTIRGRAETKPIAATAGNFARACLFVPILLPFIYGTDAWTTDGVVLAISSGTVTSGLGYVAWYATLRQITTIRAATLQLSVPALAAIGGVVFVGEPFSTQLITSLALILGGIYAALHSKTTRSA